MTMQTGRVEILVHADAKNPVLVVIQNNGAGGTPNLYFGDDPANVLQDAAAQVSRSSTIIAAGGASPQLTLTRPMYGAIDSSGGSTQVVTVNIQRLNV